jgi:hypothetical protein
MCTCMYCTEFDLNVARQQPCKHGSTCNNRWGCVFYVVRVTPNAANGRMNSQSDTWHVFSVWAAPCNNRSAVFSVRGPCREDIRVYGNRDEKGSLESETVQCGRVSRGTRTREWLRWRGPAAVVGGGPVLSSGGGGGSPHRRAPPTFCKGRTSGSGPQMGALFQGGLVNWPSAVTWDSTRPVHACAATNTNAKSGDTVGGRVLYWVHLEFMRQGIAAGPPGCGDGFESPPS